MSPLDNIFEDLKVLPPADPAATNIRLISARKATQAESRQYREGL